MGTRNFTIDTKGSCFICLKHKPEEISTPYSLQRLSKYLNLDFKNVYHISFPMEVSVLADSEILVSLCKQCSIEANKFIKLHKDLELIRKRVNTCVGRIQQSMVDADRDPTLLQDYRQRMTSTANPLELIQASIAENLRKETIEKCSQLFSTPSASTASATVSTITLPSPAQLQAPATPIPTLSVITAITTQSDNSSNVSSTTTILPAAGGGKKEVLVVDIDDSDEEDNAVSNTEPELVISSVTGASGTIFASNSQTFSQTQTPSQSRLNREPPASISITSLPSASFSALQNFTTGYDFLNEFGIGSPKAPASVSSANPSLSYVEDESWKRFSDGKSECKQCGKTFDNSNSEGMTVHQRMHAGIKPITCEYCNQKFRSASNRRIHTLTYHRKEIFAQFQYPAVSASTFQCAIDTVFQNVWKLNSESDRPFTCIYCPKQYRHKLDVEAHLVNIHFKEVGSRLMEVQRQGIGATAMNTTTTLPVSQQQTMQTLMSCHKCGLKFRDSSGLTRHLLNCSISGSMTASVSQNPQQVGNIPEKKSCNYLIKWKCCICSLTFSSQLELKRHKSLKHGTTIANVRPNPAESGATFDCQYCGKKFRFYYSQRVHMLTLHRYQVFSKYVPEGTTLEAIEDAIQTILDKSKVSIGHTHVCKFCNRDFAGSVASILQNHILVSHFQEVVKRLKQTVEEAVFSASTTQSESHSGSASESIKEENENTVEVVLPD